MKQAGEVVASENGVLTVLFERSKACENCNMCDGSRHSVKLSIKGNGSVGDRAIIDMPEKQVIKASVIAYLLPLGGLMIGLLLGAALSLSDIYIALCGLGGLGLSLVILKLIDIKIKHNSDWVPVLIAVEPKKEAREGLDRDSV